MPRPPIFISIVLDGVGIGGAPDARAYGDEGSDTLGHVCTATRPRLPNLERWGLGSIRPLNGVAAAQTPAASFGTLRPTAAGKDSTTGHWELAGLVLARPFPTYPHGFPPAVIDDFCAAAGVAGVLGNRAASGTEIIAELGDEHLRTGRPIVYTSGDSVFQVAAHVRVMDLESLYAACDAARRRVLIGEHAVGRVIARPFDDAPAGDGFARVSAARRDYSLPPPGPTVLDALQRAGVRTIAIGKIGPLFAGAAIDETVKTSDNADGIARTLGALRLATEASWPTFIWTNLVDFDELYGHRGDAVGFARALEAFDMALPAIEGALPKGARLVVTADHGNDPCFPGTDHTRERVPVLLYEPGAPGRPLGDRASLADHSATVARHFGAEWTGPGAPMLR
jgi:phosphopentomutase